ncbi:MAG: DNA-binding response regulator [Sedimenticola sp.]|jgi:DNA-binding response OmpR family regulator|nr:MAG: DNA-binding response regulator [Sedimenticola sp.]
MKILIAEDDPNIRAGLDDLLSAEGYQVVTAEDGEAAIRAYHHHRPQFVILDIMMPKKDGYTVCREIRQTDQAIPIIFLSAKTEEIDRVVGLELGADDYINKPFGTREVVARIRAITRRYLQASDSKPGDGQFVFGDLTICPVELRARRGDESIDLSLRDISILRLLCDHQGEVVTRDQLFNHCWGYDHIPNSRTLDQHISKLRKRLELDLNDPQLIKTVYGAGYRYE